MFQVITRRITEPQSRHGLFCSRVEFPSRTAPSNSAPPFSVLYGAGCVTLMNLTHTWHPRRGRAQPTSNRLQSIMLTAPAKIHTGRLFKCAPDIPPGAHCRSFGHERSSTPRCPLVSSSGTQPYDLWRCILVTRLPDTKGCLLQWSK